MGKLSCLLGLIGLGWVVYCLFQPIIDWNFGWKEIPQNTFEQSFEGIASPIYTDAITRSKAVIDSIHKKSEIPSISIASMIHGKMVWSYAVGFQDIENELPADTSTSYRIGSVSKPLTSLGLGKLIQEGEIHPDSSIQYYTSHFKDKPKITIRQLASHQSGIRNYETCFCFPVWEYYRDKEFDNVEESLSDFESDDLLFTPNQAFSYSSFNFTALSLAMESTSKSDFLDFMDNKVFNELGMNQTKPDIKDPKFKNRSTPYDIDRGYYKNAFPVNLSNKWAGGGFLSTPSDLVRAGNALLDSVFLNTETRELLTTPQRLNNDTINYQNYALGWRHDLSERYFDGQKKVEIIHHGGMAVGGLALLVVYPEYDLVLAIAINKSGKHGRFELFDYITPIAENFIQTVKNSNRQKDILVDI
jgi:CubicO group peptidase (beta-lactamase class C family)